MCYTVLCKNIVYGTTVSPDCTVCQLCLSIKTYYYYYYYKISQKIINSCTSTIYKTHNTFNTLYTILEWNLAII
jgi:hypothetical protein